MNWKITGHTTQVELLQSAIKQNKLFHSYVFCGPENIGKTTIAKRIAQSTLCSSQDKPCLACVTCKKIESNQSEDVLMLDTNTISIKQIRKLKKTESLEKYNHFFCIIDSYKNLSPEASQALLKMLEEPRKKATFIIIASSKKRVLSTILSRSIVMEYNRATDTEITNLALQHGAQITPSHLEYLDGSPGKVLNFVSDPEGYNRYCEHKELLHNINKLPLRKRLAHAEEMAAAENPQELLDNWITHFYHALNSETKSKTTKKYSVEQRRKIITNLHATKSLLQKNVNKRLAYENLCLNV